MSFISRVLNHFVNQVLVDTLANRCAQQLCLACDAGLAHTLVVGTPVD